MASLLVVIAPNLIELTGPVSASILLFFLFFARFSFNSVDPNNYGGACLLSLVPIIAAALLLPIFVGFFGDFRLVLRRWGFLRPGLWFFDSEIFHWRALSMDLGGYGTIVLGTVLISVTIVIARSESGLSLGVNRFFDYLIKVIKLLAALFYFYSH